jgi:hypothetical protein
MGLGLNGHPGIRDVLSIQPNPYNSRNLTAAFNGIRMRDWIHIEKKPQTWEGLVWGFYIARSATLNIKNLADQLPRSNNKKC